MTAKLPGDNCDNAGLAEIGPAVDRIRMAEAQLADSVDKKHLLLKTSEVGAGDVVRALNGTALRELLKTACSGALRAKECERALTLLGRGQHPKSSCVIGLPTPISDEKWEQWQEPRQFDFLSPRAVEALSSVFCVYL